MKIIKPLMAIISILFATAPSFSQGKYLKYSDGNTILQGYLVKAKTDQKAPGVVIIHQWMGLTDHEKNTADKLAALGYHALAADIYGEGVTPKNTSEAGEKVDYYKTNFNVFQSRIQSAIDQLIKEGADANNIAVIGYCFGGTGAIEAARAHLLVKGIVSFHGGLSKNATRPNNLVKTKVLVLHGADDPFESEEGIKSFQKEMRDGKADWQMIYYANAVHSFTQKEAGNDNSKGAAYNEVAAKRSWEHMKLFLSEIFMR